MNQTEASRFRKALLIIISIAFTGGLLVFTSQANLDLLTKVYVNPQYVGFGMLALEGGVLYWTGYYLLHWDGAHKAVAVVMAVIDFLLSAIGFFMDGNLNTGDQIRTALPPVLIVMTIDVLLNVGMGLLIHFLSHGKPAQNGNLIAKNGNLIANQRFSMDELVGRVAREVTGQLVAIQEEGNDDFLASRALPRPRRGEEVAMAQEEEGPTVGEKIKEAASSLTKKASDAMKRGTRAARARGKEKTSTSNSSSSQTDFQFDQEAEEEPAASPTASPVTLEPPDPEVEQLRRIASLVRSKGHTLDEMEQSIVQELEGESYA